MRPAKTLLVTGAAMFLVLLSIGCTGARFHVRGDALDYPVSLSGSLPDADGNLHVLGENLESLGLLDEKWLVFGFVYSATGQDIEIGERVNARVEDLDGEGVAGMQIRTSLCGSNLLPFVFLVPIFPGCISVHLRGIVVRLRDPTAPDFYYGDAYPQVRQDSQSPARRTFPTLSRAIGRAQR